MSFASIYLATLIARSPKSLSAIADELGYPRSNILSMFKSGHTKIPLNIVGSLADVLDGDPLHLFKLVFKDHYPDSHEQILEMLGPMGGLTRSEHKLLELYRRVTRGCPVELDRPEVAEHFADHFRNLAAQQAAEEQASRDRYDRLPRNGKHRG